MEILTPAEIGERLREERHRQGLTPNEFAERWGVSRASFLRPLEAGAAGRRDPLSLARLALALGKPWNWLGAGSAVADLPEGPGRLLCELRLERGYSLDDLEKISRIGKATINRLEHGRANGRPRTWRDLALALGVDEALFTTS